MKHSFTIAYTLISLLFFSCSIENADELGIEESLESMIIGDWVITDFTAENVVLTNTVSGNKPAIQVKSNESDAVFGLKFTDAPKELIFDGNFPITLTSLVENQTYINTYNCDYFFDDLLIGTWGIINSNLYLSKEKLHATILIQDLTPTSLKLNIVVEKLLDQEGLEGNLEATFCLTFERKTP